MKKRKLCLIMSALLMSIVSCNGSNVNDPSSNLENTSEDSSLSEESSLDIDYSLPFAEEFIGDYNRPGLYEKNGSEHLMPETQKETGMEINVEDY